MSYVVSHYHIVFGTKQRRSTIVSLKRKDLVSYIGGICRNNKMVLLEGNAVADHTHLLVSFSSTISVSKGLNLIKSNSSKWCKSNIESLFSWQREYGAFCVSHSQIDKTLAYIRNQEEHHASVSFMHEFKLLVEKHGLKFYE